MVFSKVLLRRTFYRFWVEFWKAAQFLDADAHISEQHPSQTFPWVPAPIEPITVALDAQTISTEHFRSRSASPTEEGRNRRSRAPKAARERRARQRDRENRDPQELAREG